PCGPRINPVPAMTVPIAEIVMVPTRPDEQRRINPADVQHGARAIEPAWRRPQRLIEGHRREQHAARGKWIVPVAIDEDAAGRCPGVAGGVPYPVGVRRRPEPWPPRVARIAVGPRTWHVKRGIIGGGS